MNTRFTERVRKLIALARESAAKFQHDSVAPEHLLLAMLREHAGVGVTTLQNLDVDLDELFERIDGTMRAGGGKTTTVEQLPYSSRTKKVLEHAVAECQELGHTTVGTEHLLLGLLCEDGCLASETLRSLGVTLGKARARVVKLVGGDGDGAARSGPPRATATSEVPIGVEPSSGTAGDTSKASKTPALDYFTRDLVAEARSGQIEPVFGRVSETRRMIEILCRKKKNNPVLIGEPGVGKTTIVEGLARRLASGDIAEPLRNTRLLALDLTMVLAGAKLRGQLEERIKAVLRDLERSDSILFIDEVDTLIGAGGGDGAIDVASLLKEPLARGEVRVIGATTQDAYRTHIEGDDAFKRRFQQVTVEAPNTADSIAVLKGLRPNYEAHHKVRYTDASIDAAVRLSDRYVSDRQLPDKAIDVLDEAGSHVRLTDKIEPPEIDILHAQLTEVTGKKECAVVAQDFERAAKLRDRERAVKKEIEARIASWRKERDGRRPAVTADHIGHIIGRWTGIDVGHVNGDEAQRLLRMEEELSRQVVGQDDAIKAISCAVRRNRAGLRDPGKPIGSFLFAGPTGVGKTELARCLAEFLFGDREALVRIDMSEYMERHAVSRLIGAPPGYVGYTDSGQLTKMVRRKPYSVVLLDEIDKANPDTLNILLQVLEDGHLTDGQGRKTDFKNTVVIMTSNLGARDILKGGAKPGFVARAKQDRDTAVRERVQEALDRTLPPELLNRMDESIVFRRLEPDACARIVRIMLRDIVARLAERGHNFMITEAAVERLVREGMDEKFGARPLRRAVQRLIENPLSEKMLDGVFGEGARIVAESDPIGDGLMFSTGESTDDLTTADVSSDDANLLEKPQQRHG